MNEGIWQMTREEQKQGKNGLKKLKTPWKGKLGKKLLNQRRKKRERRNKVMLERARTGE